MCKKDDCKKTATFNFVGLKPKYCGTCKEHDMVNVITSKCINDGCKKQRGRNGESEEQILYI